jgi:hypothetical protein
MAIELPCRANAFLDPVILDQLCGTAKLDHAYAASALDEAHERFGKKLANLKAAAALHFAYYNFCRVHSSVRVTPALEAGLTDHVWRLGKLLNAA